MLFQAYLSNDGLVEAVVVHHRRRRALNLTTEVEIPTLVRGIVDLIGEGTRSLPNLQVLEVLRKVHVVGLGAISGCSPPVPSTFYVSLFTNAPSTAKPPSHRPARERAATMLG